MKTFNLSNGDPVTAVGLGTWKMQDGSAYDAVKSAIDSGYRHIDCAHIYGNEDNVGRALSESFASVSRDEIWVTSKLWNDCHRAEHVKPALQTTLANLRLDQLDLYLMHWPIAQKHGTPIPQSGDDFVSLDEVPLLETWSAMEECQRAGLCRHIGVSNFNIPKLKHLLDQGSIPPSMNQVESHPYLQQTQLFDFCSQHGILFTAYSPLGSGDRPERLLKENEPKLFTDPTIKQIAQKHARTPAQIMLAWAVNRGSIAIPKSANPDRMRENLAAAEIELDNDDMQILAGINKDYRFIDGTFWAMPGSCYTVEWLWND